MRCVTPSEYDVLGLRRRAWLNSPKCLEGVLGSLFPQSVGLSYERLS
jgi:hypothetical protein